jgi:ATP-dependent DNA ligase
MDPNFDYDGYVCALVDNLEIYLFDNLFVHDVKSRDEPYQIRMKILRSQLNDKTNFRLRRGVVNRALTLDHLIKATEEELKSNERK